MKRVRVGRELNVNGTFYKQNLVTENNFVGLLEGNSAPNRQGLGGPSLSFWGAAPNREGLGGSYPCPFGRPLQIVDGWGVPSLSFWGAPKIVKGLGGTILVLLARRVGGCNPCPWSRPNGGTPRSADSPNVNGTFCKQRLVAENQLSDSWRGPILVHLRNDSNS